MPILFTLFIVDLAGPKSQLLQVFMIALLPLRYLVTICIILTAIQLMFCLHGAGSDY